MRTTETRNTARTRLKDVLRPELALVALMAVIVGMLIIPLPTILVDLLIGLNMAVAIIIFLSSFYVERILNFSSFPSVLLFTTLLRLALSVSTSRLILVDADAGHIVQAFGEFVVADNLVVGFVIFAIVTLVQFIVITKGSERIGEVVARFSLDGMPGKQMSIDADLRAEAITAEDAQKRRREVERESQLYGSYDGAMKFVKGDAIAGIVIVFVNLFGGISVGMMQHGMPFKEALSTFTLLTIGDGLVAQIPALLICISAGFVVTRVSGDTRNLGANIINELFKSNNVLSIAALLVLLLGLLPGFPFFIFLVLSATLSGLSLWRSHRARLGTAKVSGTDQVEGDEGATTSKTDKLASETVPVILLMPQDHLRYWEGQNLGERLKSAFHTRTGIRLPQFVARSYEAADEHGVTVLINEIPAGRGRVVEGHSLVLGDSQELRMLKLGLELPGEDSSRALWVPSANVDKAKAMGCELRSDFEEMFRLVSDSVLHNIGELFGIQETKHLLDEFEGKFPELVKETYRHMPVQRVSEVLQRLLREEVSIRNMKIILEALAQWGQREKDVILLVEHVRGALARYISACFSRGGRIAALVAAPATEDLVRSGIRQSQGAAFLNLDPAQGTELLDRIAWHVQEVGAVRSDAVLLVAPDIRRFVKRFIENRLPSIHVISFAEISDAVSIDVMRTI
ncbi:EscV/YscV/HrcV family type III secretion system export apparatus protein [Dyella sp. Tek66A03]|uniref:EscV/YscV/HrcV family type III secretion system export apparatus protein n=1 Tax=Dyella sp. Tek66A03 TaxID=3458298 RepID=UPI00403E41CD